MHIYRYQSVVVGCLMSLSLSGMTPVIPHTKGEPVAIIYHENEYKIMPAHTVAPIANADRATSYYTIEEDTIIPHADGYERTIVAGRDGDYTLWGVPLYRHLLTITENKKDNFHTRTIKTRIVYENKSVALFAILACGLAGIVYKIAQKVQDNYLPSFHA